VRLLVGKLAGWLIRSKKSMADALDSFYNQIGSRGMPAPVVEGCGCALGSTTTGTTMDLCQATNRILVRYVELTVQGEYLRQMMAAWIAGGSQASKAIPCTIWEAYATARQDYLTKSQEVLDQLAAKGLTIEQVIYSQGKPAVDPTDPSRVRTVRLTAPLRPPGFLSLPCPGIAPMYGANLNGGWEPTSVEFGVVPVAAAVAVASVCTAATLGGCLVIIGAAGLIVGIVSYAGYKIMQQVAVVMREYQSSPAKTVAAYTACFAGLVKGGMPATDAATRCQGAQTAAQQYAKDRGAESAGGLGFWGWIGIGAGVIIFGGIALRFIRARAGRMLAPARMLAPVAPAPAMVAGLNGARRGKRRRKHAGPILLGDLYYQPKGR
jgi:hypothetical protein